MKNMKILFFCGLLFACSIPKERIPGVYTDFHTQDKDTVWLYEDGTCIQKVYDINNVLVYSAKTSWKYKKDVFNMSEDFLVFSSLYIHDEVDLTDPEIRNEGGMFERQGYQLFVGYKEDKLYFACPLYVDLPSTWHYFYKIAEIK